MRKYNGPELERILMVSHMEMRNWEALERLRKPSIILDNLAVIAAVALTVYTCIR
jgi:hypothetical protein